MTSTSDNPQEKDPATDRRKRVTSVKRGPFAIHGALIASCTAELEYLLSRARRGEILGLAWTIQQANGPAQAGLAGSLARDDLRATGALVRAAVMASGE